MKLWSSCFLKSTKLFRWQFFNCNFFCSCSYWSFVKLCSIPVLNLSPSPAITWPARTADQDKSIVSEIYCLEARSSYKACISRTDPESTSRATVKCMQWLPFFISSYIYFTTNFNYWILHVTFYFSPTFLILHSINHCNIIPFIYFCIH